MRKQIAVFALTATATATAVVGIAPAALAASGPFDFVPIAGSAYQQGSTDWSVPYLVPEGFTQTLVHDETVLDLYPGVDDLHDMNTQNETGFQAGRYLYNTYEVGSNGAVSVTDLKTGTVSVIAQRADWNRLDGIRWTPWGSLLVTEETTGGKVFELFFAKNDPTTVERIEERTELGALRHEGIDVAADGSVVVIDELNGGSIFKFVPTVRGDLSQGQLHALKITGLTDAAQKWNPATFTDKVGAFEWVALDQAQVRVDADVAADEVGATEFGRPEDVEIIGQTLYVANTSEDRVVAIDLTKLTVSSFVEAGVNVPVEDKAAGVSGFNNPDNLAEGPDGALWITEDNSFSDIFRAGKDRDHDGASDNVELFASLTDEGAETTGIYFGKNPKELFATVQHPDKDLADGIWKITRD
ncbi:MAG TPA: alkaline phosphatase PhoX [Cryobacterium sp.]|nr:alkaline phosphatase PhoX [Cryobacterium sp.]